MQKRLTLISAFLIGFIAGHAHANETSVTIFMSVYVAPEAYETPQIPDTASILTCHEILGSHQYQQAENCQDGNTLYTWQHDQGGEDLVLTIAPI